MKAYELDNAQNLPVLGFEGTDYYILENPEMQNDGTYWAWAVPVAIDMEPINNEGEELFVGCVAVLEQAKDPDEGDELGDCYKMIGIYCRQIFDRDEIESAQPW